MASTKRPTYIVETKAVTERKRRNSDLVIMWQSICSVTTLIFEEIWWTLLKIWEFLELWFSSSERFELRTWLGKYLPFVPEDFLDSWRDGRLLAILLNKLQPGCYPDANELHPDYGLRNVYKAYDVLEMYFGIKPNVSPEELVICFEGSDSKLIGLLLQLKKSTDNQPEKVELPQPEPKEKEDTEQSPPSPSCIVKGTGLVVAFVGKITNFIIFCTSVSDLDVVIEIKGPDTICSERITKRSPKKKRSMSSWEFSKSLIRSASFHVEKNLLTSVEEESLEKKIISLEYEITGNQICVGYRPKQKGQHKVIVLWHGQHVSDSPYLVNVEDPMDISATNHIIHRKSAMRNENDNNEPRKNSVRFQESQVKYKEQVKPMGRIISRRILRYIVKINGKYIPVNAESTDSLATELLKMEYDMEACSSSHRRNSWGFAGDAERKKSVIRQFGVDVNELEAQICLKRTRSLSINPGSKKCLEKRDSIDSLPPRLNIVKETVSESDKIHENEDYYAYINEEVVLERNVTNISKVQDCIETVEKIEAAMSFEECSENGPVERSCDRCEKIEFNKISSLSTVEIQDHSVDNKNEDLPSNIAACDSSDKSFLESTVKMEFNGASSSREFNNSENGNDRVIKASKYSKNLFHKETRKKNSNYKSHEKNKKVSDIKMFHKSLKQTLFREFFKSRYLTAVSSFTDYKKMCKNKRAMLRRKDCSSLNLLDFSKHRDFVETENRMKDKDTGQHLVYTNFSSETLIIPQNSSLTHSTCQKNNSLSVEEYCSKNRNIPNKSSVNQTFNNILRHEKSKDDFEVSNYHEQEPKIKKVYKNHNTNTEQSSSQLKSETDDDTSEDLKTLRTHTLRTIELLNFKQFSPPFESQASISPVKSQIIHWESSLSVENQKLPLKKSNSSDTEQVNVKERLAFWENTYKIEKDSVTPSTIEKNKKINLEDNKKSCKPIEGNTNKMMNDLHNASSTGNNSSDLVVVVKEKTECENSLNRVANSAAKKDIDHKITPDFQIDNQINRRSFSDPGVFDINKDQISDFSNLNSLESSNKGCLNSSNDDNLEQYFSDDSDDFSGDYSQHSMEDEYIDDEISENASEYWGDLSAVKGLKVARCSVDSSFTAKEFLQNHQQLLKSFPDGCKVFGLGVYYGYVAVKNRFQIYTGEAGFGSLCVSMQGFRRHDVSLVSVVYARKDVYEVTYQVMTKGYYLITVRWMEKEIPGSPFVCKVTF